MNVGYGAIPQAAAGRVLRYTNGRFGAAKFQRQLSGNELVAVTGSSVPIADMAGVPKRPFKTRS
jgi:hypothetical protein